MCLLIEWTSVHNAIAKLREKVMNQGTELLLRSSIPNILWKLATPNVAGVSVMTAVTFCDAWFVGHLGNQALASLASAN